MTQPVSHSRLYILGPGIAAAISFAITDVLGKVVFNAGMDVLTLSTFRGLISVAFMFVWLRVGTPPVPHTPRQRWISLGVGVLFAGIVFCIFKAIQLVEVSIAILTYFIYPLLTGIIGALVGLEKLTWRGATAAVVAFLGLALTVGAHPQGLMVAGLVFAIVASCFRTSVLLITRGFLQGADARLITWYSLVSSTAVFAFFSLVTWNWNVPQTTVGWVAFLALSVATVVAVLTLFMSVHRIGPFRSALIMNLEPLLATIASALLLGEVMTPVQALGAAIMLGALVAFQLRR
jgi:drug/metabolite transporter (DMT)-like permease